MMRRNDRRVGWWSAAALASFGLVASGCGGSVSSAAGSVPGDTVVEIPETLAFSGEVPESSIVEDSKPAASSTTDKPVEKATSTTNVVAPDGSVTTLAPGPSTTVSTTATVCTATDYEVPVPNGWYSIASSQGDCTLFATIPSQPLECDCTVGVTIRSYPTEDAVSRVSGWMASGSSSPTQPTSTPVLGGAATLVSGQWELNEVQVGGTGQYESRYMYVFDDGVASVEVSAGEFQDWGGSETFADRKAAVDQIAAGLILQ